jgi:uncharacterized protein (DUF1810 family)
MTGRFRLDRFVSAQDDAGTYESALAELRRGRKVGHWIWFIFPQLAGLGMSSTSRYYAISSLDEARAYLADPVLGPRLVECATVVATSAARSAVEIFGSVDAIKVRSSMTLYLRAEPAQPLWQQVLDRYYNREPDARTDAILSGR